MSPRSLLRSWLPEGQTQLAGGALCELASGGTTRGDGIKENMSGKQERQPLDDAFHVRQRLSSLMMGLSRVSKVSSGQSQHLEEQRWMDSLCMTTSAPIVHAADCFIFFPLRVGKKMTQNLNIIPRGASHSQRMSK